MIKIPSFNDLLTIAEAADALGVTRQRVHVLIRTYNASVIRKSEKLTLIERQEVERISREKDLRNNHERN
jgi:predicted DNA-binding protein YlxM (UPF0122 family)